MGLGQSDPYRLGWWAQPWANSFRNASTAGLLEDDLDLMLDPARLPTIQGNRLYTNLSNLVGKNDDVFDDNSNNYYVIGGSGKIMDYGYGGLLYDRYVDRVADTTAVSASELEDLDANGTYDRKTLTEISGIASAKTTFTDWWFGYGRELGPGRFGALLYHSVEKYNTEPGQLTMTVTETDLVTGANTGLYEATTRAMKDSTYWVNGGALSYWYPFNDKIDLGLSGGIVLTQKESIDSIVFHARQTDPSAPGLNGTTIDSTADGQIVPEDYVGMDLVARVAGVYKWSDQVRTRTDAYFTMLVGGKTEESYQNSTFNSLVAFQVPTGTNSLSTARTRTKAIVQEDGRASVGLISNTFVTFSDKVEMAIGLGLESYNRDYTNTVDGSYNETIVYNDGDPTTFSDYSQVTVGTFNQVEKYTESNLLVSTPVCVEFHITKPFVFRLGARHVFHYQGITETIHNEQNPQLVTYTDGFGVVTQSKPTTYSNVNGMVIGEETTTSALHYTYGAGWEISKNLQIDLMGFAHLDDMTNWKLSAVFKF
ncbi:MAG: hypothetical protein MUF78_05140 [Candidatus Edwardsbacteria bacterium]|nr:hypothetical protein [Candidatus Edwardsbacteria bacterium]